VEELTELGKRGTNGGSKGGYDNKKRKNCSS